MCVNYLLDIGEREDKLPTEYRLPKPPDCSQPSAIGEWQWEELSQEDREYLNTLYMAQPDAIDRLGSTSTMSRMAIVFSARTGRPTSPHTLFRELMALRKDGLLPKRRGQK
jgi:hypothetical protein